MRGLMFFYRKREKIVKSEKKNPPRVSPGGFRLSGYSVSFGFDPVGRIFMSVSHGHCSSAR